MSWLSGWSYAKEISLTGQTGAGTDYQVDLDIGASAGGDFHLEGHCTNFPQDIEVTDDDGTTLLDFWIDDIAADPLKMYVEVADDLGSNQKIWVYYGKSGATTNSNGPNTFLQWHGAASTDFMDSAVVSPSNIAYEAKVQTVAEHNVYWGLANNAIAADDIIGIQSHQWNNLRYGSCGNEGAVTKTQEAPYLGTVSRKLRLNTDGTTAYFYVDDDQIGTSVTVNLPNENMGLWMHAFSGTCTQDWSFARKYNSPEPAFASAGAEQSVITGNPYWYYNMLKRRN